MYPCGRATTEKPEKARNRGVLSAASAISEAGSENHRNVNSGRPDFMLILLLGGENDINGTCSKSSRAAINLWRYSQASVSRVKLKCRNASTARSPAILLSCGPAAEPAAVICGRPWRGC